MGQAYLVTLEAEGKANVDGNDVFDNFHFVDAVYADVLVTSDKRLLRIADRTGNTGVLVKDFNTWASEFTRQGQTRERRCHRNTPR